MAVSLGRTRRTGRIPALAGGGTLRRHLILALGLVLVGPDAQAAEVLGNTVGKLFEERHDGEVSAKRGQEFWKKWEAVARVENNGTPAREQSVGRIYLSSRPRGCATARWLPPWRGRGADEAPPLPSPTTLPPWNRLPDQAGLSHAVDQAINHFGGLESTTRPMPSGEPSPRRLPPFAAMQPSWGLSWVVEFLGKESGVVETKSPAKTRTTRNRAAWRLIAARLAVGRAAETPCSQDVQGPGLQTLISVAFPSFSSLPHHCQTPETPKPPANAAAHPLTPL